MSSHCRRLPSFWGKSMSRERIKVISEAIPASRQEGSRHYGVHPYFTRRPANVVRKYIERYSEEGDSVLDPFGGTGVTAIEAFLLERHSIHNDLNPFANFIANTIADTTLHSLYPLREAFERIEEVCLPAIREVESGDAAARRWIKRLPLPENIKLPRTSDGEHYYDMFTPRQLAGLAIIKREIDAEATGIVRDLLLLAWSASVAKLNRTFLSAKGRAASRGGSSIFSIYRYKIANQCVELPIWETFKGRFNNVVAAKKEIFHFRDFVAQQSNGTRSLDSRRQFQVLCKDAATLDSVIKPGSIDYIFTDPPYGAFISYLDLSILWNHWLGFPVSEETRRRETIVGGELNHNEAHYIDCLSQSIRCCLRLLRPDRWFSIVFQHWDSRYFSAILDSATQSGGELKAAITQTGDVIWSMHKKKNSASVLAGEMILTFYKPKKARTIKNTGSIPKRQEQSEILAQVLDSCLNESGRSFSSESLFNRVIIELWRRQALSCLSLDRREFADGLRQRGWSYNAKTHLWAKARNMHDPIHDYHLFDMSVSNSI
jgi:adenine-specific DNA methylase